VILGKKEEKKRRREKKNVTVELHSEVSPKIKLQNK
jgi:hypothetical protein